MRLSNQFWLVTRRTGSAAVSALATDLQFNCFVGRGYFLLTCWPTSCCCMHCRHCSKCAWLQQTRGNQTDIFISASFNEICCRCPKITSYHCKILQTDSKFSQTISDNPASKISNGIIRLLHSFHHFYVTHLMILLPMLQNIVQNLWSLGMFYCRWCVFKFFQNILGTKVQYFDVYLRNLK